MTSAPNELREDCINAMEHLCTALADAIQHAGIAALIANATDEEIAQVQRLNAVGNEEFHRVIAGAVTELGMLCIEKFVQVAERALRFDEHEDG